MCTCVFDYCCCWVSLFCLLSFLGVGGFNDSSSWVNLFVCFIDCLINELIYLFLFFFLFHNEIKEQSQRTKSRLHLFIYECFYYII